MRPGRSEETAQQVFSVNDPVLPAIGPPAAELEAYYGENVAFGDFFRKLRMEEFVHYSFFELCIPFKGWNFRFVQSQIIDRQGAQGAKKAVHVHFVDNQFQRCPVDFLTVSVNKHRRCRRPIFSAAKCPAVWRSRKSALKSTDGR